MKTTIILTAAFLLIEPALAQKSDPWKRFEQEAPVGKVEVRPFAVPRHVWSEHPYGQWVRPFSMPPPVRVDDPYYPPGYSR